MEEEKGMAKNPSFLDEVFKHFRKDVEIIVGCKNGKRSLMVATDLSPVLNLTAGEEVKIEYEVDGWFYVKKKRPGRDGKMAGLVPVLYIWNLNGQSLLLMESSDGHSNLVVTLVVTPTVEEHRRSRNRR
ncbi:hypothetical protein Sjap_013049 [Stephania japonica]|uniref:SH3 domain-containing protein n=1 Tax=Stephania japonica TaxID=461633 RepID=A0AAP0IX14_9MAGN